MGAKLISNFTESIRTRLACHFVVDSVVVRAGLNGRRRPTVATPDRSEIDPLRRVNNVTIVNQIRSIRYYTRTGRSLSLIPHVM
jgi:hypothetical protein